MMRLHKTKQKEYFLDNSKEKENKKTSIVKELLILCIIMIIIVGMAFYILYNMFYSLKPNSQDQKIIGELTGLRCDKTEIVYYRITTGFLGSEKWIRTTEDKADIKQEECIK